MGYADFEVSKEKVEFLPTARLSIFSLQKDRSNKVSYAALRLAQCLFVNLREKNFSRLIEEDVSFVLSINNILLDVEAFCGNAGVYNIDNLEWLRAHTAVLLSVLLEDLPTYPYGKVYQHPYGKIYQQKAAEFWDSLEVFLSRHCNWNIAPIFGDARES